MMLAARRLTLATRAARFAARCIVALRYMRRLNYSRRLAWAMAAR